MADILADAVSAAMGAVRSALPSLSMDMEAGGVSASVVLASSVDAGKGQGSQVAVYNTMRIVARQVDFPRLSVTQPITLGGIRRMIVGLKLTGNAAWFADLSEELKSVAATAKVGGATSTFSVHCAVVEGAYSSTIGAAMHTVSGEPVTVFIPIDEWQGDEPPKFGVRFRLPDGKTATAQSVERMEYAFRCTAVRNMREGDR